MAKKVRTAAERATEYERKAKEIRDREASQKEIRELKTRLAQLRGKGKGGTARK